MANKKETTQPQSPTSVSEWRAGARKLHVLPSGNVVRLKRVAIMDLLALGDIPDTLSRLAVEVASKPTIRDLNQKEMQKYAELVNLVCCAAFAEPKLEPVPADEDDRDLSGDFLYVDEVEWLDRIEVFRWGNGGANRLRLFRPDPKKEVVDTPQPE